MFWSWDGRDEDEDEEYWDGLGEIAEEEGCSLFLHHMPVDLSAMKPRSLFGFVSAEVHLGTGRSRLFPGNYRYQVETTLAHELGHNRAPTNCDVVTREILAWKAAEDIVEEYDLEFDPAVRDYALGTYFRVYGVPWSTYPLQSYWKWRNGRGRR